jgi:hypothetical protein
LIFNHRTAYPIASALRVLKYQEKGYTIRKPELLKVVTTCAMRQLSGWEDLKQQVGGSYGEAVTLDTDKPFGLDAAIESMDKMGEQTLPAGDAPGSAEEALRAIFGEGAPSDVLTSTGAHTRDTRYLPTMTAW